MDIAKNFKIREILNFIKNQKRGIVNYSKELNYNEMKEILDKGFNNVKIKDEMTKREIIKKIYEINFIESYLLYGDDIYFNIFNELYKLFRQKVEKYQSDLIYDFLQIITLLNEQKNKNDISFYYVLKSTGSHLITDLNRLKQMIVFNEKNFFIYQWKNNQIISLSPEDIFNQEINQIKEVKFDTDM